MSDLDDDEKKVLLALYILSKGKSDVPVLQSEVLNLCELMTLDELRRDAKRFKVDIES